MGSCRQLSKSCWIKKPYTLLSSYIMTATLSLKQSPYIEYNNSLGCRFGSRSLGWFFQSGSDLAKLSWVHPHICGHLAGQLGLADIWKFGLEIMKTMSPHGQPLSSKMLVLLNRNQGVQGPQKGKPWCPRVHLHLLRV